MNNEIKYKNSNMKIVLLHILIFVSSCSWSSFSEKDHREIEKHRITNLNEEDRKIERQECIKNYQHMIDITNHETKQCSFWSCIDGKEDWKKRLDSCLWRVENIK